MSAWGSRRAVALALIATLFAACGIEIPENRRSYVGLWEGPGMSLEITSDGRLEYERRAGSATTSLSAPIKSFDRDDFVAGVWFLTTTFEVQRPPHRDGPDWKMMVDGVELTRVH